MKSAKSYTWSVNKNAPYSVRYPSASRFRFITAFTNNIHPWAIEQNIHILKYTPSRAVSFYSEEDRTAFLLTFGEI